MINTPRLALLAAALAALTATAWAGRPLATDDAGTAEVGTCQVEGWIERAGSEGAWVVAPACGVAKGLELGADHTRPRHRDELRGSAGLALKWVPEAWRADSPAGEIGFGLKLAQSFDRPAGAGWRGSETGALALATLQPGGDWTVHANLGAARERSSGSTAALLNLAVVWTPHEQALLFAETQANNRRPVFGGTLNTVGGRWWLAKDRVGLDLTASREAGIGGATLWTVGLGWYGLSF
jgi:hypothetical protein